MGQISSGNKPSRRYPSLHASPSLLHHKNFCMFQAQSNQFNLLVGKTKEQSLRKVKTPTGAIKISTIWVVARGETCCKYLHGRRAPFSETIRDSVWGTQSTMLWLKAKLCSHQPLQGQPKQLFDLPQAGVAITQTAIPLFLSASFCLTISSSLMLTSPVSRWILPFFRALQTHSQAKF